MSSKTYFNISVLLPLIAFVALMTVPSAVSEQLGWIVLFIGGPLAIWSLVSLFVFASKSVEEVKRYLVRSPILLLIPHVLVQLTGLVSGLKSPYLDASGLTLLLGNLWQLLLIGGAQLLMAYAFVGALFIGHAPLQKIRWIVK
jgi:hypothetical protein